MRLALGYGHVGEHGEELGLLVGADEEGLGDRHDLLGIDAEGAVDHAAPAARAGEGGVVDRVHGRVVELEGLAEPGGEAPLELEVALEELAHDLGSADRRVARLAASRRRRGRTRRRGRSGRSSPGRAASREFSFFSKRSLRASRRCRIQRSDRASRRRLLLPARLLSGVDRQGQEGVHDFREGQDDEEELGEEDVDDDEMVVRAVEDRPRIGEAQAREDVEVVREVLSWSSRSRSPSRSCPSS